MKIHDPYLTGAGASQLNQTQQPATVTSAQTERDTKPAETAHDSVGISELSIRLLELARIESPERVARLERLAAEIRSGRYQVDPLAVSRRIVDAALQGE